MYNFARWLQNVRQTENEYEEEFIENIFNRSVWPDGGGM